MTNAYVDLKLVEEKVLKIRYIDIFMLKIN
ncbi:Uncharacterised protein [Staphylococcus aureus]|nr:Uncharacterised protein [Staphylococcus aureus]